MAYIERFLLLIHYLWFFVLVSFCVRLYEKACFYLLERTEDTTKKGVSSINTFSHDLVVRESNHLGSFGLYSLFFIKK